MFPARLQMQQLLTLVLLFLMVFIAAAGILVSASSLLVSRCNSACDRSLGRNPTSCCISWGFASGSCGEDAAFVLDRWAAYCSGGATARAIADCDLSNATLVRELRFFFQLANCIEPTAT